MGLVRSFRGLIIPTAFNILPTSATVKVGNYYQIPFSFTPTNSTNQKVRWTSSNTSIATVDSTGKVTPVDNGTCTITASTDYGNFTDSISITVYKINTTGVSLNESSIEISEGMTFQLEATVTPADTSYPEVVWSSSNTSVATVSQNGLVTYVGEGECIITVTTVDGGYTDTCNVLCENLGGCTELEYIESTGTQYINTGYVPTVNTEIEADISWGSSQVEWAVFWGVTSADKSSDGILGRIYYSSSTGATNNFNAWFCNTTYSECQKTVSYNEFHSIVMKKNYCSVDGIQVSSLTTSGTPYQSNIYIFCGNNGGSAWRYGKCKIKSFKISDNGTLVRDFVPCINAQGAVGLYDKVNKQFYSNAGSGTFNKGPEVIKNINKLQEVEYIQSSGTQYIETNFLDTTNTKIEIDMQFTSTSVQQRLFGHGMDNNYGGVSFEAYINGSTQRARATANGVGNWQTTNVSADTSRHTFVLDNSTYKIYTNGTLVHNGANSSTITATNVDTIPLLARKFRTSSSSTTIQQYASAKLYSCKIYENETLVRDFMPCYVKSTGTIGLYDKVEGKFYINQGSGTFTAGPKIGVVLDKNSISLTTAGQTYQLTATTNPADIAQGGFTWSSSDTSIATVSSSGLVTCVTPGSCTITCKSNTGGYTDTCSVVTAQEFIYNFDDGTWTNTKLEEDGWVNSSYGLNASSGGLVFANTSTDKGGKRTKTFTIDNNWTTLTFYFKGVKSAEWGGVMGYLGTVSGNTYTNLVSIQSNYNDSKNGLKLNNSWVHSVGYNASVEGTFTYNRTTGAWTSVVNGNTTTGTTSLNFTENLYMTVELSKGYYSTPSYIYKIKAIFE